MQQTILIVEDETEIARFIQQLLEKEGFACLHSRDGLDALRQFQAHQPSLIILDWMLPGLDGIEVCTRIRKLAGSHDPYILMLTAKGEELDRVIGLSTGADDYLVKPFSPMELVARVRASAAAQPAPGEPEQSLQHRQLLGRSRSSRGHPAHQWQCRRARSHHH